MRFYMKFTLFPINYFFILDFLKTNVGGWMFPLLPQIYSLCKNLLYFSLLNNYLVHWFLVKCKAHGGAYSRTKGHEVPYTL